MRLGLNVGYSRSSLGIDLALVQHAERLGFHSVWSAEAYGSDAVSPLCWLGARTTRIRLGTVPGLSTQVFTIPAHLVRNPPLQFEVHGIGGLSNPRTETISVQPGEEITLTIPPS